MYIQIHDCLINHVIIWFGVDGFRGSISLVFYLKELSHGLRIHAQLYVITSSYYSNCKQLTSVLCACYLECLYHTYGPGPRCSTDGGQ